MVHVFNGDSLQLLNNESGFRSPEGKILHADACVSDPPYGISFDGEKEWDSFEDRLLKGNALEESRKFQEWTKRWSRPLFTDVLWPGSSMIMFGMDRMIHRAIAGLEDAGFEIRHVFAWLYATGQTKQKHNPRPCWEPIAFGRKPIPPKITDSKYFKDQGRGQLYTESLAKEDGKHPSNLMGSEDFRDETLFVDTDEIDRAILACTPFWYVPKPSKSEREHGLEGGPQFEKESFRFAHQRKEEEEAGRNMVFNHHPTVKPIALMRRLIRLVTRPGATVIDPFLGSGTTGVAAVLEGRHFIGIEREQEFYGIACNRIAVALRETGQEAEAEKLLEGLPTLEQHEKAEGNLAMDRTMICPGCSCNNFMKGTKTCHHCHTKLVAKALQPEGAA